MSTCALQNQGDSEHSLPILICAVSHHPASEENWVHAPSFDLIPVVYCDISWDSPSVVRFLEIGSIRIIISRASTKHQLDFETPRG
jgi:hypothetical protein